MNEQEFLEEVLKKMELAAKADSVRDTLQQIENLWSYIKGRTDTLKKIKQEE